MKTKKDVLDNEKDYVPFIVNKHLSYFYDCVLFANEMNKIPNIDKRLQYDYLINTVRSVNRPFVKWHKKVNVENLNVIKQYYNFSNAKAEMVLSLLNDEQINDIKKKINKGGTDDKSNIGKSGRN